MGQTSAGLTNGGLTDHYQISYDDSIPNGLGLLLAEQLMDECEIDFQLMQSWFGVELNVSLPMNVQLTNDGNGASWGDGPVNVGVFPFQTGEYVRYLLVSEVTEMFMQTRNNGWFYSSDEGSKGEALSRFLGLQFLLVRTQQTVPYHNASATFAVVPIWLNSSRPNFVDNNPDDHNPDIITGCTTCFIYYLYDQLDFTIVDIINAGADTLADVYKNLTGKTDAWSAFSTLVTQHYPPGVDYHPAGDAIFPVANLSNLSDVQITSGQTQTDFLIGIDNVALTNITIALTCDNPALLSIPTHVTLTPGTWTNSFPLTAAPITGPIETTHIHASYAGKTLTNTVQILPRPSMIEGRVTDAGSHPISDAAVLITAAAPISSVIGTSLQLSTDANGFYQTPAVTPQTYQIQAGQSGYVTQTKSLIVGIGVPTVTQNFALATSLPFTVYGTVTSLLGGPIPGAAVQLVQNAPIPGYLQTTTDGAGDFTLSMNPEGYIGTYGLTVSATGFVTATSVVTIPNGASLQQSIVLTPLGALTGTVSAAAAPVANATVATATVAFRTGANGQYTLTALPPGAQSVTVTAIGYDPLSVQISIAPGQTATYNFALEPASATISGTVTNETFQTPIANAKVSVAGAGSAMTDATGAYSIGSVPAGSHLVTVMQQYFITQTAPVSVIANQHVVQNFDLSSAFGQRPPRSPTGQPE